jgi:2-polyprenyl-3-methyl-5-hydroxy-6-metoxy-1,4-benzoquinol methylase
MGLGPDYFAGLHPRNSGVCRCVVVSLPSMAIEVDPAGVEPGAILQAVDFHNAHVLEVGAGDGRLTFRYAEGLRSVVGIDTKEPEIQSAAKVPRAEFRGCAQFLCASATALPFSAEEFEIVLLASSL